MSPIIVFLLLFLCSAPALSQSSQVLENILASLKRSNLAIVHSRLRHDLLPAAPRDKIKLMDKTVTVGAPRNRLGVRPVTQLPNYWFKVCTKCPKYTWFLVNLEEKEAAEEEAVRTSVIHQVVLWALGEGLTKYTSSQTK